MPKSDHERILFGERTGLTQQRATNRFCGLPWLRTSWETVDHRLHASKPMLLTTSLNQFTHHAGTRAPAQSSLSLAAAPRHPLDRQRWTCHQGRAVGAPTRPAGADAPAHVTLRPRYYCRYCRCWSRSDRGLRTARSPAWAPRQGRYMTQFVQRNQYPKIEARSLAASSNLSRQVRCCWFVLERLTPGRRRAARYGSGTHVSMNYLVRAPTRNPAQALQVAAFMRPAVYIFPLTHCLRICGRRFRGNAGRHGICAAGNPAAGVLLPKNRTKRKLRFSLRWVPMNTVAVHEAVTNK